MDQPIVTYPCVDVASGEWVAQFVMASVNVPVVHRTHVLLGRPWGDDFRYDEAMMMGEGLAGAVRATALAGGMGLLSGAASVDPVRSLLKRVVPKPGSGPTPELQESGFFDLRFLGETESGEAIHTRVHGDRDPGYGATARMLSQAALAFADPDLDTAPGGVHTPTSAFGDTLIDCLVEHAGLSFSIVE